MDDELQKELLKKFSERFEQFNQRVLKELGDIIGSFKELIPKDAHKLAQQLRYNTTISDLIRELSKISSKSIKDIEKILKKVVEDNIEFASAYYQAKGLDIPIYEESKALQHIVISMAKLSQNEFVNIARTTGFKLLDSDRNPIFLSLEETYYRVIDEAVYAVTTGKDSYNQQMKSLLNQLADSGVRRMEYESGYTRRIDSAARMNVIDTIRQTSNECQRLFGKEFGADGVEITVENNPAPDHEDIQGRQFSHEEYQKFQNHEECRDYQGHLYKPIKNRRERRKISQYNCRHVANQIILGINRSIHSNEELQEIIDKNKLGVEIDGKRYTMYEASQLQRRIETEIRYAKEKQILAECAKDDELILKSQQRVTQLKNKYEYISKQANLAIKQEYTYVPNYKTRKIKESLPYDDVTQDWLDKAIPNSDKVKDAKYYEHEGIKYNVDGKNVVLDYSKKEKEIAEWLEKTFGGEIYMLPRINNPKNIETPDYIFKKEYWDLKEITGNGKHTLDSALKKKKNQSQNFIFDISLSKMNIEAAQRQIKLIMSSKDRQWVKKIIVKKNEVVKVHKKRG